MLPCLCHVSTTSISIITKYLPLSYSSNSPYTILLTLSPESLPPPLLPHFHHLISFISKSLHCMLSLSRTYVVTSPMFHQYHSYSCALCFLRYDIFSPLYYDNYEMPVLPLPNFITQIQSSYSALILYLGNTLLAPLLCSYSTPTCHIFSTCLHSAPLQSYLSIPFIYFWSNLLAPSPLCSTLTYPIILLYTCPNLHLLLGLYWIGSAQFGSACLALLYLSLLWTF